MRVTGNCACALQTSSQPCRMQATCCRNRSHVVGIPNCAISARPCAHKVIQFWRCTIMSISFILRIKICFYYSFLFPTIYPNSFKVPISNSAVELKTWFWLPYKNQKNLTELRFCLLYIYAVAMLNEGLC